MLEHYLLLGTLGFHSVEDIRTKQITVTVTLISAIIGLICHIVYRNNSIYSVLGGIAMGALVLVFSLLSGGKIGPGDGVILMLTGLYLGAEKNLGLIVVSLFLAAVWALISVTLFHYGRKDKIPFVPFLFLAYFIMMSV